MKTVVLLALLVLGVAAAVLAVLQPWAPETPPAPPGGGDEAGRDPGGSGGPALPGKGGDAMPTADELVGSETAPSKSGLARRLATAGGAAEVAASIAGLRGGEARARAFLRLLGTDAEGVEKLARDAATGDHGDALRIPAIVALAGTGRATDLLAEIAGDEEQPDLALVAVAALSVAGDPQGQSVVAGILEAAASAAPEARIRLYDALNGTAPGLALGRGLVGDLLALRGAVGLRPDGGRPGPYHRIVAAVGAERNPEVMPRAAGALARLDEPAAQEAVLGIWERSEGEAVRHHVLEAVFAGLPPREGATMARMARSNSGPEAVEMRRRALQFVRGEHGDGLESALRDWAAVEPDPAIREELNEELRRLETAPR